MKKKLVLIVGVFALLVSCKNEPEITPSYSSEWKINIHDYLGIEHSNYISSLHPILLQNGRVLINFYHEDRNFLVEVDIENGKFVHSIEFDEGTLFRYRKTKTGKILLMLSYDSNNSYAFGYYNESLQKIEYTQQTSRSIFKYQDFDHNTYIDENFVYTHDLNISPSNTNPVYLSKWKQDGELIWTKEMDDTKLNKISLIHLVSENYLLYSSVSKAGLQDETYKLNMVSTEGELLWSKKLNNFGRIYEVLKDDLGNFYAIHKKAIFKFDKDGNEIWSNTFDHLEGGFFWSGKNIVASNGSIFLSYSSSYTTTDNTVELIQLNQSGAIEWSSTYWEKEDPFAVSFLETPSGDILTTSFKGFVTYYVNSPL